MGDRDRRVAYLIASPAIILAFILKIIPIFGALKLPFIDYNSTLGMKGSPYIGFRNFENLFSTYHFRRIVSNTLILKLGFIFVTGAIALGLGLALSYIKKRWLKNTFIVLFTIPFFVPTSVFSYIFLETISARWFVEVEKFRVVYIILVTLKSSGVLAVVVSSLIRTRAKGSRLDTIAKIIAVFLLVQLSSILTVDFELLNKFINPLVYNTADTIDTYIYRTGILNGEINRVSPSWFIRFIIQFFTTIGVYYTIKHTYIEEYTDEETAETIFQEPEGAKRKYPKVICILICIVYVLFLCLPIISLFKSSGVLAMNVEGTRVGAMKALQIFIKYSLFTFLAGVFNLITTILLSYPLTIDDSKGKFIYEIFLLVLLVSGQGGMHEYLYYKDLGMTSTVYPYILNGFFSIMGVLVLANIHNRDYPSSGFRDYIIRIYRPALALAGLQFITMWNSYYPAQILYMHNVDTYSPIVLFESMVISGSGELTKSLAFMGLLISVPSIIMGALLCIFADRRIFISYIRD